MGNAKRDENYVPTLLGVSSADGATPVTVYVDPITHRLLVSLSGGTLAGLTDVTLTSVAQGDILYYNGTKWVNLAAGSSGNFLKTQGAGANPVWAAVTSSPAGSDTQVQFNDGGSLAGDAGMTYNKTTDVLTVGGLVVSSSTGILPSTNDGCALGSSSASFSDLFLASGAVVNYANGNVVITHSSGILTMGTGEFRITTPGTNAASVPTLGSTSTFTNKTLDNTNTVTLKDTLFTLQDDGDTAKQARFQLSGITTSNTRVVTLPDANTTLPIASQVITFSGPTAARTLTLPDANATMARTDAGQIFTGTQTMTSPKILTSILDTNGNEVIDLIATASAVNEVKITNAATGVTGPIIEPDGETNIDLRLGGKGTGKIHDTTGRYGTRNDLGSQSSGTQTFNWAVSNVGAITLTGSSVTIAFSNQSSPQFYALEVIQDGTGSRTISSWTSITWAGGAAPTLTTTASKRDLIGFYYNGSITIGVAIAQNI